MSRLRIDNQDVRTSDIFEILLDNFPDIIHSVDNEGNIVYTNKKAEELLGYTREELLSMNIRQLYPEEILDAVEQGFQNLKQTGVKHVESMLKDRNGNRIPVEIRSFSIYDDNGRFMRTFSILRDIRPMKELQNSLVHSGRLAAIGEMASGIMHDVANPLTVIIVANSILKQMTQTIKQMDPEVLGNTERCVQEIARASKSIEKLVQHMRQFARSQIEAFEVLDVNSVVKDALFITQNRINAIGVVARNRISPGAHFVAGAPNRLEQVFVNLIANACDAMEGRETRELSFDVSAHTKEGADYWLCAVADTGRGIPKEIQEDIFHSFFTTKEKSKGTGLGLSIVRGILSEHKGEIWVESEPGKGATFFVALPKAEPVEPPGSTPGPASPP